jgi:STE24 endopeptidase
MSHGKAPVREKRRRAARWLGWLILALAALPGAAAAELPDRELPPGLLVPAAARPGPDFDVERATQAYLDLLNPEQKELSDAYEEGNHWLELWQLLYGLGTAALLLLTGWSRRMRQAAQRVTRRVTRRPWAHTYVYVAFWVVAMFLLNLPMGAYANFLREHRYALSNESFGAWLREDVIELGIELVLIPPVIALVYAAVRRVGPRWWIWAGAITFVAYVFIGLVGPTLIAPLFNRYDPLPPGEVREQILSLARANRIAVNQVYVVDSSRQTTRIGTNVSGLFGATRISLNDNLLRRTSLPEIRLVMAHEMGHYLLNHPSRFLVYITLLFTLGFWIVHVVFDALLARWGARLGLAGRGDPAGLPLAIAILSLFFTVITPVTNGIERQIEAEADAFAINTAREPHGFASAAMRLSTYRKIKPTPLEEALFYDHPSGYDRVHRAMTWLKENPQEEGVSGHKR